MSTFSPASNERLIGLSNVIHKSFRVVILQARQQSVKLFEVPARTGD